MDLKAAVKNQQLRELEKHTIGSWMVIPTCQREVCLPSLWWCNINVSCGTSIRVPTITLVLKTLLTNAELIFDVRNEGTESKHAGMDNYKPRTCHSPLGLVQHSSQQNKQSQSLQ